MSLDHKKIDKKNKTLVDLRTKCLSESDTSQEANPENMGSIPVTHTPIGQVNIVIRGLVHESILKT